MNGVFNGSELMPQDHGAPRADVIDVFIAINIDQVRAFATLKNDWLPTDGPKSTSRAVHASGHQVLGSSVLDFTTFAIHS